MAEVLVLIDHADGRLRKATAELLTIARRLGEPSAVLIGPNADAAQKTLAKYGGAHGLRRRRRRHAQLPRRAQGRDPRGRSSRRSSPAAVLIPSNADGKEIAARLAIKTGSGMITDAVDVRAGDDGIETTQSVFAGNYTVTATVTTGHPDHHASSRTRRPSRPRPRPAPSRRST